MDKEHIRYEQIMRKVEKRLMFMEFKEHKKARLS